MGLIKDFNKYPYKETPAGDDYLIGSDSEANGKTKSFKVSKIRLTAAQIEALLDAYYGSTAWRTGGNAVEQSTKAHSTTVVADKFYFIRGSNRLTTSGNVAYTLDNTGAKIGGGYYIEVIAGGNHVLSFDPDPYEYKIDGATGVTVDTENGDLTLTSGNKYTLAMIWQGAESGWAVIVVDAYFVTGDVTAPTIGTFAIPDANPDRINFVSSEVITASTFGGFTISTGQTITGITINAGQLTGHYFTVDSAFDEADGTPTIAYSGTGCNIQDSNSNALASFTATNITNNVVDPPTLLTAEIGTVADNILAITTDKAVNVTTAGWNIDTDGAALSISSVNSGSGTTSFQFLLSRSVLYTEILNVDYDQTTGNTLAVTGGKELNTVTNQSVTNNVSAAYEAEASALFARMAALGSEPVTARKDLINTAIVDMKTNGDWAKIVALQVYAAHAQNIACLNWKADQYNGTINGGATFTIDRQIKGDASTGYIASGLTPSALAASYKDDILVGVRTSTGSVTISTGTLFGTNQNVTEPKTTIGISQTGASGKVWRVNDFVGDIYTLNNTFVSNVLYSVRRTGAASKELLKDTSSVDSGTATSVNLPNRELFVLAENRESTPGPIDFCDAEVMYLIVADSTINLTTFASVINTYLTAIGAI